MTQVFFSDIDLLIDEEKKEIVINPKGERFYFLPCEEQYKVFRDAILRYDSVEEKYEIEGEQTLYSEHKGVGLDYEKLLCLHPQELIHKKSFFGFTWYNVCGVLKREIRTVYLCQYKEYRIHERLDVISKAYEEK
ncbi:MAG: hypothetical protein PHQ22_10075 [Sulfuricurvum sp.]|nr:hypothetical protein [Sulfuricurvum sp.]MDD5387526.1 hypothetical protein [Sulfuricurvum sp.]